MRSLDGSRIVASSAALVALAAFALHGAREGHAEVVDPTVSANIFVGALGGESRGFPTERGSAAHDGRVESLPLAPKPRWQRAAGGRIDFPPVVDPNGNVIVAVGPTLGTGDGALVELAAGDGTPHDVRLRTPLAASDLGIDLGALQSDNAAAAPVVLTNGVRVVVTIRGWVLGVRPGGTIAFRTRVSSELASVPRAAIVPLPSGGFVVARKPELIELDGSGAVVDRARIDVAPALAVRASGEVLALEPSGDVVQWRASRNPRALGNFGVQSGPSHCIGGLALGTLATAGMHDRAVCTTEHGIDELDLVTGKKKTLVGGLGVPFRTAAALGISGELATVIAGGSLYGVGALGADLGPYDVPGAPPSLLMLGKDGGISFPSSAGEVAPLVARDGAVAWASADGVAIVRAGTVPYRVSRCSGSVAGLASAGPGTLVVACSSNEGKVELWVDGATK